LLGGTKSFARQVTSVVVNPNKQRNSTEANLAKKAMDPD
jgi:hypothetical protein